METPSPPRPPSRQAPEAATQLHSPAEELEAAGAGPLGPSVEPVAAGDLPKGSFLDALDFLKRWVAHSKPSTPDPKPYTLNL